MNTAVLEGVNLAYDVEGSGGPLLLIQGLGYGRTGWGPVPALFAQRHTVVTFDNRGFGGSDVTPGPYTTSQLARDALAVLDDAEIERADVIGISLGGMIAQELVLEAPERVRKLVLCSTTAGGPESLPMPEKTVALMGRAPQLDPQEAMRLFVENALSPDPPAALVDEIVAYRTRTLRTARAGTRRRAQARHTTRWVGSATFARRRSSSTAPPTTSWTRATRR